MIRNLQHYLSRFVTGPVASIAALQAIDQDTRYDHMLIVLKPASPAATPLYIFDEAATNVADADLFVIPNDVVHPAPGRWRKMTGASAISMDSLTDADTTTVVPLAEALLHFNGTNWVPLKNIVTNVDPVPADDGPTGGYSVGSRWYNTTSDEEFVCLDTTAATAVWKSTTSAALTLNALTDVADAADADWDTLAYDNALAQWVKIKNNRAAADPVNTDGADDGYAIGSRWINTVTLHEFVLLDPDVTNTNLAIWKKLTVEIINDLADVDTATTAPAIGDRLIWNGTNWVPDTRENISILTGATGNLATVTGRSAEWQISLNDAVGATHAAFKVLASNNGAAVVSHVEFANIGTFVLYTVNVTCVGGVMTLSITNNGVNTITAKATKAVIGV